MLNNKPLTVITAPSCAGKDYLSKCLFTNFPDRFEMVVSSTTRPPRKGEVDGVDYNFLPKDEFLNLEQNNQLLESVCFGEKHYGTSEREIRRIQEKGLFPVLIVEPEGAINIWNWCHNKGQEAQFAFIDIDREVALDRFLERFLEDYSSLISGDSPEDDVAFKSLIENYAKRIFISLYEESQWKDALPYTIKLGKMIDPLDSLEAAIKIKEGAEGKGSGVPDQLLSLSTAQSAKTDHRLKDMGSSIQKTLSIAKKYCVNEGYLKNIILKCEHEKLNQCEFNL